MKICILERNSVGSDIDVSEFERFGQVEYYENSDESNIADRVSDADIVVCNKAKINEDTIGNCPNVKMICEFATGYDNIDLSYCRSHNIAVTNVSGYSTEAVCQHTFALALYLLESLPYYDDYVKSGAYGAQKCFSNFDKTFFELSGKTWGIIGMGAIGQSVATVARSFGCEVVYHSVSGSKHEGYRSLELDELLAASDIISVHCPLTEQTRNLIDLDALSKMKKTAILINVARGPVVNNRDLATALEKDLIKAAGLDVLEIEPIREDNPLNAIKDSNKLIITPHMAWGSLEARTKLVSEACKNVESFLNGQRRNRVD